jgi:biotin carboxyl carrier protein
MDKCFVIQPFDNGKYDKRFIDTFEPAITKANFEPYRIDRDLSVKVPIDDIEKGISESSICFAEITSDNPNVWYELGYAFACNKDVVMVCSDERQGKFPFDIQHRFIITYQTGSLSDFQTLEDKITKKIKALQQKTNTLKTLQATPVVGKEGLSSHEIAILILLAESHFIENEDLSISVLKSEMGKAGYTDIATAVGVKNLEKKNFISTTEKENNFENTLRQSFTDVKIPVLGESAKECVVSTWLKKDGDYVNVGDVICEVETDKATFEIPAESAGTLHLLNKNVNIAVKVGQTICKIETDSKKKIDVQSKTIIARLTSSGEDWVMDNQEHFVFRKE